MIATTTFAAPYFPLVRLALSCAQCGIRLLDMNGQTVEEQDLGYRRVYFDLSDGTLTFISFCPECASKPWTVERIAALERQCKFMWKRMQTPGTKAGWSGDELTFTPAARPVLTWAEVQ